MPNSQNAIKYILLAIFTFLIGYIIWPFLPAIIFALIFTISFYPLFKIFNKRLKIPKVLSAILVLLITLIFIFTPLVLFFKLVATEAFVFVKTFDQNVLWDFFDKYSNLSIFGFDINLESLKDNLQDILGTVGEKILSIASNIALIIANVSFLFFVFLFLFVFFLIDSEKLLKNAKRILPFNKQQNELLLKQINHVSKTVFIGNIIGAILSGTAIFIIFNLLAIPGALIWALLAVLLSLIPTIGAFLVYATGAIIVFFTSGFIATFILIGYYILFEIVLIQSIIKPKLIDEKISVHPVLVFFGIIGGIHAFNTIGLIYGPLIVVLFVSMYEFVIGTRKET